MTVPEIIAKIQEAGDADVYVMAKPWFHIQYGWNMSCFAHFGRVGYGAMLPDPDSLVPPGLFVAAQDYVVHLERLRSFPQCANKTPVVRIGLGATEFRDLVLYAHGKHRAYYRAFPTYGNDSLLRHVREEEMRLRDLIPAGTDV